MADAIRMQKRKPSSFPPALMTNGLLRKTLAATRSLGLQKIPVWIGESTGEANPSAWSKYCKERLRYPNPRLDPDGFIRWLSAETSRQPQVVFYPMDDDVMDVLMDRVRIWPKSMCALLPSPKVYWRLRDKARAVEAASAFGFECPETWQGSDETQLAKLAAGWTYPRVVRASLLSGSRGFHVVQSPDELIAVWRSEVEAGNEPLVQQYVSVGERVDVCLLMSEHSHAVAGFVQRELRHFPMPHGPSTAQESIQDDDLLRMCRRFAHSVGWRGVLELEFMRDANTGVLYFMEANTRFWNSLQCSVQAGVDFPWLYYRMCVGWLVKPVSAYKVGIRCRTLLPMDMLHYFSNRQRKQLDPPFFARREVGGYDDILSHEDAGPVFGYLAACASLVFRRQTWRDVFRR